MTSLKELHFITCNEKLRRKYLSEKEFDFRPATLAAKLKVKRITCYTPVFA